MAARVWLRFLDRLWVRATTQRQTGLWQSVNADLLLQLESDVKTPILHLISTPSRPFPWRYCSFITDPLLVLRPYGSLMGFISCMKMCCIPAIDLCPKCDELKYSWKWKEDVCVACECVLLQRLASSSYGISALLPWVVSEYIRIAKYEKGVLI